MPKPTKPYKSFPLTPHVRGGWGKRYKKHQLYLPDADPDKALADFHRRAKLIDEGREPARVMSTEGATVGEVATRFTNARLADKDAGRLSLGTYADYAAAAKEMIASLGRDTLVSELTPDDFTRLYRKWADRLGAHALARNIQAVRTLWATADENEWIDRKPRFGSVFKKPMTGKREGNPLAPTEIRKLIDNATGQIKAMILLGINAAYGAKDCSDLPRGAIDLDKGLAIFPRPKMKSRNGIDRACTLWPETVEALRDVMVAGDNVFARNGGPWVKTQISKKGKAAQIDAVAQEFYKVCNAAEIERRGFYELRHAFRTIADELEKPHATARIMGHRLQGLAQVYVDRVEHHRLKEVADYVRLKVYPSKSPEDPHT